MATFSLSITGYHAATQTSAKALTLDDTVAGRPIAQGVAMQTGAVVPCKKPDGSIENYIMDNERSRPGGPIYLLKAFG